MKIKVTNKNVARLWAARSQPCASGSHFYFNGNVIYSYCDHFPIARHTHWRGEDVTLFTNKGYSTSTARHKCYAMNALCFTKRKLIFVNDVMLTPDQALIDTWEDAIRDLIQAARDSRHVGSGRFLLKKLPALIGQANEAMILYGVGRVFTLPANLREIEAEVAAGYKQFCLERTLERAKRKLGYYENHK